MKKSIITFFVLVMGAFSGPACAVTHFELPPPATSLNSASGLVRPGEPGKEAAHLPIVLNDSVEEHIDRFATEKTTFQIGLNNAMPYLDRMKAIFRHENIPEELVFVVMIESLFDPFAVSGARAGGLWQFMPRTARAFGLRNDKWVDERKDHLKSTRAAARYFKELHGQFHSWALVMAAYNAGMTKVRRAIFKTGSNDFWDLRLSGHLRKETVSYVPKIMAAVIIARDPEAYGFRLPDTLPIRFDVIEIRKSMDLRVIASEINSTLQMIKALNPEIKGMFTPPRGYLLKIPEGKRKISISKRSGTIREPRDLSLLSRPSLPVAGFHKEV